jgi:hypothetical protein
MEPIILPELNRLILPPSLSPDELTRNLRNKLLKDQIDTVNPVRYESLTEEQRQELRAYRQALLDAPQQSTWPLNVEWPTKPTWL